MTEAECTQAGKYWYDNACHDTPKMLREVWAGDNVQADKGKNIGVGITGQTIVG